MALDRIKRQLADQAAREADERRRGEEYERSRRQSLKELVEKNKPALQCLAGLEGFFWECVSDFSKLTGLGVKSTNRSLFYPLRSTPTDKKPVLSASLVPPSEYLTYNEIWLSANRRLEFTARCTRAGKFTRQHHGEVQAYFPLETFEMRAARDWLESLFERYYENVQSLRNYR